ncbi:uncharacterized protein LOC133198019 [Saccostrea echinata]|uniref:uncharacterized protein LOC133198019 n=1 Tax=Saccostrea echinata TaxID=191078 RepID=UPI002A819367|nr:uncharacterized protein LOC133198019 [Saccostrea echinata]
MQDQEKREFGLKLQEIAANAQALDILINPEDFPNKSHPDPKLQDLDQLSISYKAKKFMESHAGNMDVEDFYNSINYSKEDISNINEYTQGQATNEAWYEMRVGLLTASNFKQANKYIDDKKEPSKSFMRSLMGENRMEDHALPAPLKWGREKENVARDMYFRLRRRQHRCLRVKENGLLISEEFPVLGCSVDGICTCKCIPPHPPKIVEIKCPYSMRNEKPKDVAVKSKCIYDKSSGTWIVTPDSAYYAQIQGQLGLYGYENADLVIYTQKGIHVSHVHFDKNFFSSMAQKLVLFHKMYVLPVLLKQ